MPTRKEITDAIDSRVKELLPFIAAKQDSEKSAHGKCAQLLWSHSKDPKDGIAKKPDKRTEKPIGRARNWNDFGYPIESPVANAAVDEYVKPDGECGWVLKLSLIVSGETWRKAFDGGEGGFGHDWRAVNREIVV